MSDVPAVATTSLTSFEGAALWKLRQRHPFVREVLSQVEKMLDSQAFGRVRPITRDFLRFVVSKTLIGGAEEIKEMTIAIRVFHESADFNPLENSKIRVAGLALRRRVADYYAYEGLTSRIQIRFSLGSYIPRIYRRCLRGRCQHLLTCSPRRVRQRHWVNYGRTVPPRERGTVRDRRAFLPYESKGQRCRDQ